MFLTALALAMALPQCARQNADLPRGLSSWTRTGAGLDTRHATVLRPRNGRIETRVTIRKGGIFGLAIDGEGWIDVAPARGKTLRMVSENRGPRCSTIRKIVRFRLQPGAYRVTVDRVRARQVRLMLVHGQAR